MKYFSEDNEYVNAECGSCSRILKINKENLINSYHGFVIKNPNGFICVCGTIHHNILKSQKNSSEKISKKTPTKKKAGIKDILQGLFLLALIFIGIPALIISSCVRSCKQQHAEIVNKNKGEQKNEQSYDEWRKEKFLKSTPEEIDAKGGLTNEEAKWLKEEAEKQGY